MRSRRRAFGPSYERRRNTEPMYTDHTPTAGLGPARNQVSLLAAGVFLLVWTAYLQTVAPLITLIDSGEHLLCMRVLGNPHSPGYPGTMQLGHAALMIPLGDDAYRGALMGAFCGALGAAWTAILAVALTGSLALGGFAGLSLGFARTFWEQAANTEVYCLAHLWTIALVTVAIWPELSDRAGWPRLGLSRQWSLLGFVLGAGVIFHQVTLFAAPGAALAALWTWRKRLLAPDGPRGFAAVRPIVAGVSFLLLGHSLNLYLPIRAACRPFYAWEQPDTLTMYLRMVSTSNWNAQRWVRTFEQFQMYFNNWLGNLGEQFPWIWLPLALWGAVTLARRWPVTALCLFPLYAINTTIPTVYFNLGGKFLSSLVKFYVGGHWILGILAAIGLGEALALAVAAGWTPPEQARRARVLAAAFGGAWLLAWNFGANDLSQYRYIHDWGRANLLRIPSKGTLIFNSDEGFVLSYLQVNEGLRRDVALVYFDLLESPRVRESPARWYLEQTERNYPWRTIPTGLLRPLALLALLEQGPVATTFGESSQGLRYAPGGWRLTPQAPGFQLTPKDQPFDSQRFMHELQRWEFRNPPISQEDRARAERDYLDSLLQSLAEAYRRTKTDPPGSYPRHALRERLSALDPAVVDALDRSGW